MGKAGNGPLLGPLGVGFAGAKLSRIQTKRRFSCHLPRPEHNCSEEIIAFFSISGWDWESGSGFGSLRRAGRFSGARDLRRNGAVVDHWLVLGVLLAGCGVGALLTAAVYLTQLRKVKTELQ